VCERERERESHRGEIESGVGERHREGGREKESSRGGVEREIYVERERERERERGNRR